MTEAEEKLIEAVLEWSIGEGPPIRLRNIKRLSDRVLDDRAGPAHPYGAIAESMLVEPRNVMPGRAVFTPDERMRIGSDPTKGFALVASGTFIVGQVGQNRDVCDPPLRMSTRTDGKLARLDL